MIKQENGVSVITTNHFTKKELIEIREGLIFIATLISGSKIKEADLTPLLDMIWMMGDQH